jgi:hypothetical protein
MSRIFALLFFLFVSALATAQVGLNGRYVLNDAQSWTVPQVDGREALDLLGTGYALGIDYWVRFQDVRIELLPELNFSRYQNTIERLDIDTEVKMYSLLLRTNIYFLDMSGDCFCPTFYQEGPTLQKGLHLQISPGLHYFDGSITGSNAAASSNTFTYSIGAGLGFDLGISKYLTITPIAGIRYFPGIQWEAITEFFPADGPQAVEEKSSLLQYSAGIRIGLLFGE